MQEETTTTVDTASRFTGGAFANYFIGLISNFVTMITLGIAYPFMACWKYKWRAEHTYIYGQQLTFDGNGLQLFGQYIKWFLLSIITCGIYFILCARLKLVEWETSHTHFAAIAQSEDKRISKFSGKWYQLLGVNWVANFVTLITLSIGQFWAHCYRERWYAKHKTIDGCELMFDGTGMQYFGKRIAWLLLTLITCGIYVFWLTVKTRKWTVMHTTLLHPAQLPPDLGISPEPTEPNAPSQPAAPSQTAQGQPSQSAVSIIGLVMSIMGNFAPIGLLISIVALVRARKSNQPITIPLVGVIIGAIMTVALVAVIGFILLPSIISDYDMQILLSLLR